MKSLSSLAIPRPSLGRAGGTACMGRRTGRRWNVTARALAWVETQITHGLEALASAWACVDSNPANNSARHTHNFARKRCARRISSWLLPVKPVKLRSLIPSPMAETGCSNQACFTQK